MKKYFSKTFVWQTGVNDKITPKCSAIVFKNAGDVRVKINDAWILEPGDESPTISTGHPDVVDLSEYDIVFDTAGGGTTPLVNALYTQIFPITTKAQAKACENL